MYCFSGRETFVEYWQLLIKWFEGGALSIKCNRILFSIFERAARCLFLSDFNWGWCSFEYTVCVYYICGQFVFHFRALLHLWSIITFVALTSFLHVIFPIAVLLRASASGHQSAFWSMAHLGSCQLPNLFFYYGTHRPYSLFFLFCFIFLVVWLRKK